MKKSWEILYQVLLVAIQRPYFMISYDGPHTHKRAMCFWLRNDTIKRQNNVDLRVGDRPFFKYSSTKD